MPSNNPTNIQFFPFQSCLDHGDFYVDSLPEMVTVLKSTMKGSKSNWFEFLGGKKNEGRQNQAISIHHFN